MSNFHARSLHNLLRNMLLCKGNQVCMAMLVGCVVSMQNCVNYACWLALSQLASGMGRSESQKFIPGK